MTLILTFLPVCAFSLSARDRKLSKSACSRRYWSLSCSSLALASLACASAASAAPTSADSSFLTDFASSSCTPHQCCVSTLKQPAAGRLSHCEL